MCVFRNLCTYFFRAHVGNIIRFYYYFYVKSKLEPSSEPKPRLARVFHFLLSPSPAQLGYPTSFRARAKNGFDFKVVKERVKPDQLGLFSLGWFEL